MRVGTVLLTVILVAPLARISAAQQPTGVEAFVRVIHAHGFLYADAARFTSEDSATLIDMLADVDDVVYWPNAAMVLGIIGDDCAVNPLINFVQGLETPDIAWSPTVYRGRLSGITGLGYLARKRGNEKALTYLVESVDPEMWSSVREIPWLSARRAEEARRRSLQLSAEAIRALELSEQAAAHKKLVELAASEIVEPYERLRRLIDAATSSLESRPLREAAAPRAPASATCAP